MSTPELGQPTRAEWQTLVLEMLGALARSHGGDVKELLDCARGVEHCRPCEDRGGSQAQVDPNQTLSAGVASSQDGGQG